MKMNIEEHIRACATEDELCTYSEVAKGSPELYKLYQERLSYIRTVGTHPTTQTYDRKEPYK